MLDRRRGGGWITESRRWVGATSATATKADSMRFYGRGREDLGRRSPTAQLPASQPGILLSTGVGMGSAPVGRESNGRKR
jgi:hypothetical protein